MSKDNQTITAIKTVIMRHDFCVHKDGALHVGMFNGNTQTTLRGVLERTKYNLSNDVYTAIDVIAKEKVSENVKTIFLDFTSLDFGEYVYFKTIRKYVLNGIVDLSGKAHVVGYCPKEVAPTMCITGFIPDERREYIVFSEPIPINGDEKVFFISHGVGMSKTLSMIPMADETKIPTSIIGVFCLREERST